MSSLLIVVTLLSLALAAVASVIAFRVVREARRRSETRIAALARDIAGDQPFTDAAADSGVAARGIFSDLRQEPDEGSRAPFALAAGALIVGTAIALTIVLSSGERPSASTGERAQSESAPAQVTPLELVSLAHERSGAGLSIRGLVRNPATGHDVDALSAVVVLLSADGRALGSAQAPVQDPTLRADDQTSFLVKVPRSSAAARYRVSFRAGDRVVPHLDKREGQ